MSELGFWKLAQAEPDALALVDPSGREWTRGELFAEANRIAHGLRAAGLERGDCVALVLPNCWEFIAINLAVTQIGLYMSPINNHLTGPEIAYIVKDSGAKVFFGSERFSEACQAAREEIGFPSDHCFSIGSVPGFRPHCSGPGPSRDSTAPHSFRGPSLLSGIAAGEPPRRPICP